MNKNSLDLLFLGGDKRQEHIYKILSQKFKSSKKSALGNCEYDPHKLRNADIIVLPTIASLDNYTLNAPDISQKILLDDIIKSAKNCKVIIAGKISESISEKIKESSKLCYQYIESQPFKILNAIPTAEGAVSIAINNTEKTLWGSKCLVIGNGCIGKALSKMLDNLGAAVVVAARKDMDFADISWRGLESVHTERINDKLSNFDIIFNTVPHRVLSHEALLNLGDDKLIIDLASKPYGLDHSLTDNYKCNIILGSSLPGIYSPVTAAEIAATSIEQIINEVSTDE